jgi:hypothetical protein
VDLKVKVRCCKLDPQGAEDIFIEWFRHNQVITELHRCDMDSSFLSDLRGNHYVKKIAIDGTSEKEIRSLIQALPGIMGIEHLTLCAFICTSKPGVSLLEG